VDSPQYTWGRLTDSATRLFWDSSVSPSRLRWLCNALC